MPVATPPHKPLPAGPGPDVRLSLCRAAVAGFEGLGVSDVEVRRGGTSWTVDTLRELDGSDELTWIVGGDTAASLPSWREPEEILRRARLGIAERAEHRRAAIEQVVTRFDAARIAFFAMPRMDISSTDVRARVAAGRSVRHLVPAGVADAIAREGLYR